MFVTTLDSVDDENDMVCFTFNEKHNIFVPWGFNSVVRAVKTKGL